MPGVSIRKRVRLSAPERRRQIVDAATALIAERGYWGLSVQDVADACGITVNGVLHHVGSKDGLLIAVLEARDAADVAAFARFLGLEGGSGDDDESVARAAHAAGISFDRVCEALVRRNSEQPEIVRLYSILEGESLSPSHPAHAYFAERQQHVLGVFASYAPPQEDPAVFAARVLALMDGLQIQWLRDPDSDLVSMWAKVSAGLLTR